MYYRYSIFASLDGLESIDMDDALKAWGGHMTDTEVHEVGVAPFQIRKPDVVLRYLSEQQIL